MHGVASASGFSPRQAGGHIESACPPGCVRIVPTSNPVLPPNDSTTDTPPKPSWQVEIHRDGQLIGERTIKDPFTQNDHDECRWYLESHVRKDALDPGRADRAVSRLKLYAKGLALDLNLQLQNGGVVELAVEDNLPVHQDPKSTIHRLHWELLEDPQAWGVEALDLRIRRILSRTTPPRPAGLRLVLTPEPKPLGPQVINILHVVARDRNSQFSKPTDISPYMALSVLVRISKELKRHGFPVRLNITTIRPGTFLALRRHLVKLASEGNTKPFHLAHFDLHGAASTAGGAQLFFETASGSTEGRSAADVAKALSKFDIPFVVLNACRSARADLGRSANTAAVLNLEGGAGNVLAMSFETLPTAAELFLRTFYTEFLLRGATFGCAAQRGRAALRENQMRPAMFDRRLPLSDWFFPVTYTTTGDLAIVEPADALGAGITWESGPMGRDYDIGRLERLLADKRKAFVHGHAWIGKTAFLQYARDIWAETSFADEVIYVDLASTPAPIRDGRSLIAMLRSQVRTRVDAVDQGNKENDVDAFLRYVSDGAKVLIMIDGLDAAFTAHPSLVPSSAHGGGAGEIRNHLTGIFDACKSGSKKSMILFCGRRAPPKPKKRAQQSGPLADHDAWAHAMFKLSESVMQLEGLPLTDSLDLCGDVIHRAGAPAPRLQQPGVRDSLELLCRLLLGIPGAICSLIPVGEGGGTPWQSLRDQLLTGGSLIYRSLLAGLETQPVFREFGHVPNALIPEQLGVLLLLGLFWHQGPYDNRLADAMIRFGVCNGRADVDMVLDFASERGYIRLAALQDSRRISFVHPIFTVYCRTVLEELVQRSLAPNTRSDSECMWSSSLSQVVLTQVSGKSLDAVVRVYSAITSSHTHTTYGDRGWLEKTTWFLENVDYQLAFQSRLPDDATNEVTAFKIQQDNSANHFVNTLSCFRLCLDAERNLEPHVWPLDHFVKIPSLVMSAGTPAEASLFAEQFQSLLARLLQLKPAGLDSSPELANWFVVSTVSLGLLRKSHANTGGGEQWMGFVDHALRLCNFPNPHNVYQAAAIPLLQALKIGTARGPSPADVLLAAQAVQEDVEQDPSVQTVASPDDIARGLSRSAEEARAARRHIKGVPSVLQPAGETILPTDDDLRVLAGFAEPRPSGDSSRVGPAPRDTNITVSEREFEAAWASLQSRLRDQARQAIRPRTGVHMFLLRHISSLFMGDGDDYERSVENLAGSKQDLLRQAEAAMNRADWPFLARLHLAILQRCLQDGDMRQANDHFSHALEIIKNDPAADPSITEQLELIRRLSALIITATGIAAADRDRVNDLSDVGPAIDEMEQAIRAISDEEMRHLFLSGPLVAVRKMQERGLSARLDADDWAQARAELAALGLRSTATMTGREAVKRRLDAAVMAQELIDAVWDAAQRGQFEEGLDKLGELERLGREEPTALFTLVRGEESLMKMRAFLMGQARRQASSSGSG